MGRIRVYRPPSARRRPEPKPPPDQPMTVTTEIAGHQVRLDVPRLGLDEPAHAAEHKQVILHKLKRALAAQIAEHPDELASTVVMVEIHLRKRGRLYSNGYATARVVTGKSPSHPPAEAAAR
jgi:hypothetical protein